MSIQYLVLLTLAGQLALLGSHDGVTAHQAPASSVGKQLANFTRRIGDVTRMR
jgi:hypothetical protein